LKPKNIVIPPSCSYSYHEYQIERDGMAWTSPKIYGQNTITSFTHATYPYNLGVGSQQISIKATATCGDSGWAASKTLTITGSTTSLPHVFLAGFFKEYNRAGFVPDVEVVEGSLMNMRIINDPIKSPPWPYDPDGDSITYLWDFAGSDSAWIRQIGYSFG